MVLDIILNWLDLLWIPAAYFIVRKGQRVKSILFVLLCIICLRLQVELMNEIGFHQGFFRFIDLPALYRGYWAYGGFIAVFLGMSRWSREQDPYIFIAAGIAVFIAAFCVSTFIMVL